MAPAALAEGRRQNTVYSKQRAEDAQDLVQRVTCKCQEFNDAGKTMPGLLVIYAHKKQVLKKGEIFFSRSKGKRVQEKL